MSDVDVKFLNQVYSIPEELEEFVLYLQHFESVRDRIMPLLTEQIKNKTYSGYGDEDFIYFKEPLTAIGKEIITDLAKKGIFDVTIDDLVYNNKGYIQLYNVCTEHMQVLMKILLKSVSNWAEGVNNAYSSAASTITGSGMSIWTNSPATAILYSAMEASTIKKQTNQADIQYRNAIASLNKSITNQQEREETNLLINQYYPGVAAALNLFVSEMMEYYLNKLQEKGVFDYSKVKKFNLLRSTALLDNISLVPNKEKLLGEAFSMCPYNPDVYNAALNNQLIDYDTFETARYFHQDSVLCDAIGTYVNVNLNDLKRVKPVVKILASYKEQSELSTWKSLYLSFCQSFSQHYKLLDKVISSRIELIRWVKGNITKDSTELAKLDSEELSIKVNKRVYNNSVSDELFNFLLDIGLLSHDFCSVKTYNSISEINEEYSRRILEAINQLIIDLRDENNKRIDELENDLSILKSQRKTIGVLAFFKKREIDTRIEEIEKEITVLRKNC